MTLGVAGIFVAVAAFAGAPPSHTSSASPTSVSADARDDALFGSTGASHPTPPATTGDSILEGREAVSAYEAAPADPLKIGGLFYLRSQVTGRASDLAKAPPSGWGISLPALVDAYLDARPNDRVRAMLVARLRHDPTTAGSLGFAFPSSGPAPTPIPATTVSLDQLWMRFDVSRRVFVTAGRQHVKWGTARFWNHTDYLHPTPRDPLTRFDARSGVTMLKLHVPWESRGWNAYGVAFVDESVTTSVVGRLGGAGRAEIVLGPAEFGLDAVSQRGRNPKFGADLSAGLGPVDVRGEIAWQRGWPSDRWRRREFSIPGCSPTASAVCAVPEPLESIRDRFYEPFRPAGWVHQIAVGADWEIPFGNGDSLIVSGEYSHNSIGYERPEVYPALLVSGAFTPFFLARRYAALSLTSVSPGTWNNTTIVLSGIGNLSDNSYVARLDWLVTVLTHLRLELFAAAHAGTREGEFRLGFDLREFVAGLPPFPPQVFSAGLALRVSL